MIQFAHIRVVDVALEHCTLLWRHIKQIFAFLLLSALHVVGSPVQAQATPGIIERMAKLPGGRPPGTIVAQPNLSYDGRYVLFSSIAENILPGMPPAGTYGNDPNYQQWYLFDRQTRQTERISVNNQGVPQQGPYIAFPNGTPRLQGTESIDISRDGRYVVFDSHATNLVPNDTNNASDVFLFDRSTRQTKRLSNMLSGAKNPRFNYSDTESVTYLDLETEDLLFRKMRIFDILSEALISAPDLDYQFISAFARDRPQVVVAKRLTTDAHRYNALTGALVPVGYGSDGRTFEMRSNVKISDNGKTIVFTHPVPISLPSAFRVSSFMLGVNKPGVFNW